VAATLAPPAPFIRYPEGTILFTRTDEAREHDTYYEVAPDGSKEARLEAEYSHGVWSPDGTALAFAWGDWDTGARPAIVAGDGSAFRFLAAPEFHGHLFPAGWSADGSRVFATTGGPGGPAVSDDLGLYAVAAADGGGLTRLIAMPADHVDLYAVAPDWRHILITRMEVDDSDRILLVANIDGSDLHQVSPEDAVTRLIDFDWWDDASEAWSPDGRRVAFNAHDEPTQGAVRLFVAGLDGKPHQIVGEEPGATTVRWSPDGRWLAFTSKFRSGAQIWRVRPDGSGLKQLTFPADGFSVMPIWSPDSTHLLFQRQLVDEGPVTLWTMRADGSDQRQLSPTPIAGDLIGGYAWWPPVP
jgi:Tol biopolymer transport system component